VPSKLRVVNSLLEAAPIDRKVLPLDQALLAQLVKEPA
jgi:hypothetical protein